MKIINKLIIAVILGLFISSIIQAQEVRKTGTTSAKFLSIGVGPRAIGMGGAFSAVADDPSALYWNPAGIAQASKNEAFFSYREMFADISLNYFALIFPMGEVGTFGVGVTAMTMGDMEVTTENYPEGTGEKFGASSYAFSISFARNITENFIVGATAKYIRETIYNSAAQGIAFDIGTIFTTPFYGIRFSSSISNYGTKMQMEGDDLLRKYDPDDQRTGNNESLDAYLGTDRFELPLKLQIGVAKDFTFLESQRFTIAVDAAHPNDNSQYVNVGGELSFFNDLIAFRGGFKSLFMVDREEGLTLGAGINYDKLESFGFSFDYAFQDYSKLDDVHTFGITLKF